MFSVRKKRKKIIKAIKPALMARLPII